MFKVIALAGTVWQKGHRRTTERDETYYVTSVSWAPGDGLRMRSVRTSSDRSKAARFRPEIAAALVEQLASTDWTGFGLVPTLEDVGRT